MTRGVAGDHRLQWSLVGTAVLVALGVGAWALGARVGGLNELLVAVALGAVFVNVVPDAQRVIPPAWLHNRLLQGGIVLMGATISVEVLTTAGTRFIGVVLVSMALTLLVAEVCARLVLRIPGEMGSLLAGGTAVCGVSAVVAIGAAIEARREQITIAIATVVVLDAVTLFVYPWVGSWLQLSEMVYGMWAGLSMLSTGPVAAAGFAHSETAGQWATVTKLARNLLIGVLIIGYAVIYRSRHTSTPGVTHQLRTLVSTFPLFIIGFIVMVTLANTGWVPSAAIAGADRLYRWCFLVGFVGFGMGIDARRLATTAWRPLAVAVLTISVMSGVILSGLLMLYG